MVSCSVRTSHDALEEANLNAIANKKQQSATRHSKNNEKKIARLICSVHNYDWGIVGNENSQVARLFSLNSGSHIYPHKPYAELWIGTHQSGPSFLDHPRIGSLSLKDWIDLNPNVLGNGVLERWGCDLPFLLKVLSVGKALSIQAHPDKEFAKVLHKSQPSVYRDDNHKPEMALAITEFEALCGFIGAKELRDVLCRVPELQQFAASPSALQFIRAYELDGNEDVKTVLESIFSELMLSSREKISEVISSMKRRLNLEIQKRELTDKEKVVLRLENQYPADVGVMAAFLLNYVKLKPGEALYLGANEPHAYISGQCIECMANSDNVVRAGLTPKHRDTKTLLSMLKYKQGFPEILRGVLVNPYTTRYLPQLDEFEVDVSIIPQVASVVFPSIPGPSLLLFMTGMGKLAAGSSEERIEEGQVLFVPAYTEISISAESAELRLYRVGVNSRFFCHL